MCVWPAWAAACGFVTPHVLPEAGGGWTVVQLGLLVQLVADGCVWGACPAYAAAVRARSSEAGFSCFELAG